MNYFKDRIRSLFRLNDSPHELATAFALGIFIAFSPTIGLHTVSSLLLAWAFRLSKIVVLTAAFVNNPWTIVPMYGSCLWVGMKLTGAGRTMPHIAWNELNLGTAWMVLKPYVWPFVTGTLAVGCVAALISYGAIYWAVTRFRKQDKSPCSPAADCKAP